MRFLVLEWDAMFDREVVDTSPQITCVLPLCIPQITEVYIFELRHCPNIFFIKVTVRSLRIIEKFKRSFVARFFTWLRRLWLWVPESAPFIDPLRDSGYFSRRLIYLRHI